MLRDFLPVPKHEKRGHGPNTVALSRSRRRVRVDLHDLDSTGILGRHAHPAEDALRALARVVRAERVPLSRLARREGLRAEDALDCVHDAFCTFLQLAVRGALPDDPAEHGALLAGVVVNTARNMRRRHHLARPHRALDAVDTIDTAASTETLVAHAEECVRLRACVDRLCATQRTVVLMRMLEERPGEDVAAALGLTRGHVDVLLHRAKASLLVCMTAGDDPRRE